MVDAHFKHTIVYFPEIEQIDLPQNLFNKTMIPIYSFCVYEFSTVEIKISPVSGHVRPQHRRDSIQGTDYIGNYFFLNLRVSRAKIENLKGQISGDIIRLTFGKYM